MATFLAKGVQQAGWLREREDQVFWSVDTEHRWVVNVSRDSGMEPRLEAMRTTGRLNP